MTENRFICIIFNVGGGKKNEYPALYQAGIHRLSMHEAKAALVTSILFSSKRPDYWKSIEALVAEAVNTNSKCKILIDGSFTTRKIDPGDVDVVIVFDSQAGYDQAFADKCTTKTFANVDSYVVERYPASSPEHLVTENQYNYWVNWFGKNRAGSLKGIVEIDVA